MTENKETGSQDAAPDEERPEPPKDVDTAALHRKYQGKHAPSHTTPEEQAEEVEELRERRSEPFPDDTRETTEDES
jgi:hypothetical protein